MSVQFTKFTTLSIALVILTACTTVPEPQVEQVPLPTLNAQLFGTERQVIDAEEVLALTPAQQKEFLAYFNANNNQDIAPHRRILKYLERILGNFNYMGETLTAEQTLTHREGNCMSLAILTTALARLVDIEMKYQLVDSAPVFSQQGNTILSMSHVRSVLFDPTFVPEQNTLYFVRPSIIIDYYPNSNNRFDRYIDQAEFIAMYYSNKAAKAIVEERYDEAYWHLNQALSHDAEHAPAINMLAVIHKRSGDELTSEDLYKHGIEITEQKLNLLANYRILLKQQGRNVEVNAINRQLARMNDPNPFDWLNLAHLAFKAGDYREASQFYQKAAELAPYLHEAHLGLARTYYQRGRINLATRAMKNALVWVYDDPTKNLYKAKMASLQSR